MTPKSEPVFMGRGGGDIGSDQAGQGLDDQIGKRPFHQAAPAAIKTGSEGRWQPGGQAGTPHIQIIATGLTALVSSETVSKESVIHERHDLSQPLLRHVAQYAGDDPPKR